MAVHDFSNVDILDRYGRLLAADPTDKTYGRSVEVEALARALGARRSAVLIGPPGVGKTAVLRKLVHHLEAGRATAVDGGARVWELSSAGLCADTSYTGEFESKMRMLLTQSNPRRILYMPDLWTLPGAGAYDSNPRGAYDLLRPGIESGALVIVGEMTAGRWQKLVRVHPSMARDFTAITIAETDEDTTRDLMVRAAADLAAPIPGGVPGVRFEKSAVERALTLARKFLPTLSFPGKGVETLRSVAAAARPPTGPARIAPVDPAFVEEVFSQATGLPLHMISPRVRVTFEEMRNFLDERVLGQPEAVSAVADVLAVYKTGLKNPERPAGVLLFVGPTGVGKTELAKATAEFLFGSREALFRVDLSEFKDYHSFEKLIGDPRQGTTGGAARSSGALTDHVRQHPFSVILLDEFEKGHQNVADLFLQVFDDGRLTDGTGDTVDFRHTLLILTSNVGSDVRDAPSAMGFGDAPREGAGAQSARVLRALEASYRPEFLNRIDHILVFHALDQKDMRRIAQRELGKLYRREGLLERDLLLEVDDGVIDLLLERGFDPKYGARPLKRAIEELLVRPIARSLLAGAERRFQLLRIARAGNEITLACEETESSRKLATLERRARTVDGEGRTVKLSVAEARAGLGALEARLEEVSKRADVEAMRTELATLAEHEARPGFWEQAFGKGGELYRRHRLTVEVRRFDDLRARADLLHEMIEASYAEAEDAVAADILSEYARLGRRVSRAERELVRFTTDDHRDACLTVRAVGGKDGGLAWARELAAMYAAWASDRRFAVTTSERGEIVEVRVEGPYAFGYLKGEAGGHRLITSPRSHNGGGRGKGHDKAGETWLARVAVTQLVDGNPQDPKIVKGSDDEAPVRTYDRWRARGVRDRRTSVSDGDIERVLKGRIDAFLEALVDQTSSAT